MWGYDKLVNNGTKSPTYDTIICVTETYLSTKTELDGVTRLYVPAATYNFALRSDGKAYNITYNTNKTFSFNRFLNGLDTLIAFYNTFESQLSLLDLVLEAAKATDWSVGEVPASIATKKYTFTVDVQDIYSFIMNDLSHTMKVVIDFDRVYKKVNIIDLSEDDTVFETGIVTSFQNLLQTVDISTGSADGIKTVFKPTGGNDLGITYVNFGKDKISNLDYFVNKVDKYGDYQYGTAELHTKYNNWKKFRNEDTVSYTIPGYELNLYKKTISNKDVSFSGTRKQLYIELSKAYNQTLMDIKELTYLVPSDGAMTDYTTFPLEDLKTVFTAYLNAYYALIEIYKTEYGKSEVVESEIINTYFYPDYKLYKDTIIPNVKNALKMYAKTNANGDFVDANGNVTTTVADFVFPVGGNPEYNGNADLVDKGKHDAFLYDMTLYGESELNIKKKAWAAAAAQIYKDAFVKSGTPGTNAVYRTWAEIVSAGLVTGFTSQAAYEKQLGQYLDYMSTTVRANSLTKTNSKGVVVVAAAEITKCESVLNTLNSKLEAINAKRTELANEVTYEGWGGFTDKELSILYSLSHEADYTNENILTVSTDDIVTTVPIQEELLEDAEKRLFEKSRPQYSFSTSLDNIFALEEFAPLKDHVKLLNYFYLRYGLYDDETFKLRIVKISMNPLIKSTDMSLEFSNMTYTFEGLNDYYYLFDEQSGVGSSSGSSSSSGSGGGTYGTNDAEIEISNNMLNALLKNANTANSLNIDNLLTTKQIENLIVQGDLTINGKAITNLIQSRNFPGSSSNPTGSKLDLENGNFSFGGGRLTYDPTNGLKIKGYATDTDVTNLTNRLNKDYYTKTDFSDPTTDTTIDGGHITTGLITSKNAKSWISLENGTFGFGGESLKWDGTNLVLKNGGIQSSTMSASTITGSTIITGMIKDRKDNTRSYIDLTNNKFSFGDGSTAKLSFDGSTLTIRGDIVAGSIGNKDGSTYIKLSDGSFKFGTDKLTYDVTNGLKVQGTISGSTISGGTISGTSISGGTITGTTIVAGLIKDRADNPRSTINLTSNKFSFSDGTTTKLGFDGSTLTIRGDIVAGSIGSQSGNTYINLSNNNFKFGGDKLTYDGTTLSVKGNITGSSISGGTISGTSISGGTISGTKVTGSRIEGDSIFGVAKHPISWAAGTYTFNILYGGLILTYSRKSIYNADGTFNRIEYYAEEHLVVIDYIGDHYTTQVVQLHDTTAYNVSISLDSANADGTYKIRVTTSGINNVAIWCISLG